MTRQRRAILEILSRERGHPTGDEVYRLARRRLPRISLGTVYRNLDLLSEQGLIRKIEVSGRQRRFDGRLEPHCHVRCTACGHVEDVVYRPPVSLEKAAAELEGWEISGHSLELMGRCPGCIAATSDLEPRDRAEAAP
ncbi:MAG: transcriptional repressor [Armatimonadota bacterium]|jgi:Fur family ferric uptake transcriptional regulator